MNSAGGLTLCLADHCMHARPCSYRLMCTASLLESLKYCESYNNIVWQLNSTTKLDAAFACFLRAQ